MKTKRIHAATLLLLLSTWTFVGAQAPSDIKGHLKMIEGTPVLLMWGTTSERGVAEGYLLGEQIVSGFRGFALSKSIVPMPKLWETFLKPLIETRMTVPSRVKAHATGIIEGIRRRDPKLLRLAELDRDLNADDICAIASLPDVAGFFCSSFAALPKSAADGKGIVVGRNLDYKASQSLLNAFVIRVHAPDGERNGWLDIGYAGLPGCLTGFSDAGAYVAIHDVRVRSDPKARGMTPRMIALQDLMESFQPGRKSSSIAVKRLNAFSYGMGGNAMLAWDKPASKIGACVLEFGPATGDEPHAVARLIGQNRFIACSNHFRLRSSPRRCRRFKSIITTLALGKPVTTAHAWEVIESASVRGTLYRLIADLRTGEVQLDRKIKPRTSAYAKRLSFNYRALLREASESQRKFRGQ